MIFILLVITSAVAPPTQKMTVTVDVSSSLICDVTIVFLPNVIPNILDFSAVTNWHLHHFVVCKFTFRPEKSVYHNDFRYL